MCDSQVYIECNCIYNYIPFFLITMDHYELYIPYYHHMYHIILYYCVLVLHGLFNIIVIITLSPIQNWHHFHFINKTHICSIWRLTQIPKRYKPQTGILPTINQQHPIETLYHPLLTTIRTKQNNKLQVTFMYQQKVVVMWKGIW